MMLMYSARNKRNGEILPRLKICESSAMVGLDERDWEPVPMLVVPLPTEALGDEGIDKVLQGWLAYRGGKSLGIHDTPEAALAALKR